MGMNISIMYIITGILGYIFLQAGYSIMANKIFIFNKARKASFKETKLITSAEPSIKTRLHLYDRLIKPILLNGSKNLGYF